MCTKENKKTERNPFLCHRIHVDSVFLNEPKEAFGDEIPHNRISFLKG